MHLCNVLGENVFEEIISTESLKEIQLKNISDGIYFVKVLDGGKHFVKKLIVEQDWNDTVS